MENVFKIFFFDVLVYANELLLRNDHFVVVKIILLLSTNKNFVNSLSEIYGHINDDH